LVLELIGGREEKKTSGLDRFNKFRSKKKSRGFKKNLDRAFKGKTEVFAFNQNKIRSIAEPKESFQGRL